MCYDSPTSDALISAPPFGELLRLELHLMRNSLALLPGLGICALAVTSMDTNIKVRVGLVVSSSQRDQPMALPAVN